MSLRLVWSRWGWSEERTKKREGREVELTSSKEVNASSKDLARRAIPPLWRESAQGRGGIILASDLVPIRGRAFDGVGEAGN